MELLQSLWNVVLALWALLTSLVNTTGPWVALFAWVAFWTLAVDWRKLFPTLNKGAVLGLVMLGVLMVLVWGVIAPPYGGTHQIFGLKVSNFVDKAIWVTGLIVAMFLCASLQFQLSGCCPSLVEFSEPAAEDTHGDDHGHGH